MSRGGRGLCLEPWIVWSNEHRAFWAPNRCGYTTAIEKAGRYSREDAENICRYAAPRANSTINVGTLDWWAEAEAEVTALAGKSSGARFVTEYSYAEIINGVRRQPDLFLGAFNDDPEIDAECGLWCAEGHPQ